MLANKTSLLGEIWYIDYIKKSKKKILIWGIP